MKDLNYRIQSLIDEKIAPVLESHQGSIRIQSLEDRTLTVLFEGACRGCPAAQLTFEDLVEAMILQEFSEEIDQVILYQGISDEMMRLAKSLMKGERERISKES